MNVNTECTTCESCEDTLGGLNSKLISIADKSLYNVRYGLNREVDYALFKLLIFYKGVLESICDDDNCNCYYVVPLNYSGNSNTCTVVAYGTVTLTTDYSLSYEVGDRVRITSSNLCAYIEGVVSNYYGTELTIAVSTIYGSGEHCCWTVNTPPSGCCAPTSCASCNSSSCTCADSYPNSAIEPARINQCICGCCPPLNSVCNQEPFVSTKYSMYSTTALTRENIIERIKILTS